MKIIAKRRCAGYGLVTLLTAFPIMALAVTTVTVKVTVVAPPSCVINDDKPIEVDFGEVMTTRVDGSNYRLPVTYTLDCKDAPSNAMKLQVQGAGADFDGTVLQTNKTGLGIELQQGDAKLPVNGWLNFTYPNKPELWAVPVKQNGATLTGGEFTAGATMKVDYQ
ncbi:UNVERIFIED_CONTAM: fimbrial protein [Serratia marcescens]